jgi:diketogulonate reductase-like aldo/keto reductase
VNSKPLGQTGVLLPEIGLGTWDYHGGIEPLRAGLEAGALFVDTAESYGSEPVVGQAVAGLREKVFLATKVSPEHFRFDDVLKAADASLQRLGVQHIDLYQLHAPSRSVPIAETLGAMEKLVDDGKVRFIGVSNFSVNELKTAQNALREHRIAANQVRYNLVDRTIEKDLLAYCQANHITVIAYSPLGRELQRIRDCDPKGILNEIARATGKTVPQVVLNWCLCKKDVVVIPKGNSVQHVLENCGASGWSLNSGQLQRLNEGVQFRQRSRAELALRRFLPRAVGSTIKRCINLLPPVLRRHVR